MSVGPCTGLDAVDAGVVQQLLHGADAAGVGDGGRVSINRSVISVW
jgi:hypothetical protein